MHTLSCVQVSASDQIEPIGDAIRVIVPKKARPDFQYEHG